MKIVQINTVPNGSTGNIALAIHSRLLKEGHDSYFFYGIGKTIDSRCQCFESPFSIHLHSFLSKLTGLQGYFSFFSTKRMIRKIIKIDPDIVHLHNYHGNYLNLKALLRYVSKNKKHLIITLHDCCFFTGKCPHFSVIKCEKWKTGCFECPQIKRYPMSYCFDRTKKIYRDKKKWIEECEKLRFVAVSNWMKKVALESFIGNRSIVRIYNGVDEEVFKPDPYNTFFHKYGLNNKKIILSVSSVWNSFKGLSKILEMSHILRDDERIVLVGITKNQGEFLPPNIIGVERTDSADELCKLYSSASVFVTLSAEESFGLVVVEALMSGTPCVSFDSTALSELIQDGVNGYLVPISDEKNFLSYVRRAMELKAAVIRNREAMVKCFNKERMIEDYINEYEQFLKE